MGITGDCEGEGELVTSDARHQVCSKRQETLCGEPQQVVADIVAVSAVDLMESGDVDLHEQNPAWDGSVR